MHKGRAAFQQHHVVFCESPDARAMSFTFASLLVLQRLRVEVWHRCPRAGAPAASGAREILLCCGEAPLLDVLRRPEVREQPGLQSDDCRLESAALLPVHTTCLQSALLDCILGAYLVMTAVALECCRA
jgi:hypothetical protein